MRFPYLIFALLCCLHTAAVAATPLATVTIHGEPPRQFRVEVAATPESRSQGLMYRTELADDAGMLFIFERAAEVAFWMRNTYLSLDMIFIDQHGKIVHIHPDARPLDDTLIGSGRPVTQVLEINGGLAAKLGIEMGQTVTVQWPVEGRPPSN